MIKFLDLKLLNQRFEVEFKNTFDSFLNSGQYILGNQVESFEAEFANYCGTKFCVGVDSGLNAIKLILEAYKIKGVLKEGDEVIIPANTYIATILAVTNSGLKPVFIEPDIKTFNISPDKITQAISKKTKAILGVHLYGRLYDVEQLEKISKKYNLLLIEDSAQAHGAKFIDGRKAGNVSNAAAFSFYPTKNLGALGDAGAITTNNEELAKVIFKLRNYGRTSAYINNIKGYNSRLDELQAAFLRIKLKNLDSDNNNRKEKAKLYFKKINNDSIILPNCQNLEQHVFHLFVIRNEKRDELKSYLYKNGVEALIHYPIPIHKQLAYKEYKNLKLPITEKIHNEVISLPMSPLITDSEIEKIADVLNNY